MKHTGTENAKDGAAKDGAAKDGLAELVPLLTEVNDLKRIRTADAEATLSERSFLRSWAALLSGENPERVARREAARSVASARLGGMDEAVLTRAGLSEDEARSVIRRGFDAISDALPEPLRTDIREELGAEEAEEFGALPYFAEALARQPRAGCTRPGSPRLILEPPENHAEHCQTVAVYGVLLCGRFGAEASPVFLAGLAHHLHNAILPDSGFAGEELLGEHLGTIMERLNEEALAELPATLAGLVREALELVGNAESAEARAFNAADVLDRTLQMKHYARASSFTLEQALEEMGLVHEGPLKDFHEETLAEADIK